jgi:hypothetical protein
VVAEPPALLDAEERAPERRDQRGIEVSITIQ